jgi:predicted outer membrane repeat protein
MMHFRSQRLYQCLFPATFIVLIAGAVWVTIRTRHKNILVCSYGCDFTTIQAAIDNLGTTAESVIEITDPVHTEAGILVNKDVIIQGGGPENTIIQANINAGEGTQRVFWIANGTSATIQGITIRHGNPTEKPQSGGAIHNEGELFLYNCVIRDNQGSAGGGIFSDGKLTLIDCTVSHNTATGGDTYYECNTGGGIKIMSGEAWLTNSTVSGNTAKGKGGGIHVACHGVLHLDNSTISGNQTTYDGGGVYVNGVGNFISSTIFGNAAHNGGGVYVHGTREKGVVRGVLNYSYSIIAGNTITFTDYGQADCMLGDYATIGTNSYNLVEDGSCEASLSGDPLLSPLADNGGYTETHAPLPGSPLIDAISADACNIQTDQRNISRPVGAGCDIGAVECNAE